ncbi:MAG: hypothetical protein FK732_10495 [Asgard group archaeon]|nr:hypothetical protein [Asgard group archaeon]
MKVKNFGFISIVFVILFFLQSHSLTGAQSSAELEGMFMNADAIIADHTIVNRVMYDLIPESAINHSKDTLHIAYGHTSHGSQITTGMSGLPAFKESKGGPIGLYDWNEGGTGGALDIDDYFMSGDLGNPNRTAWATSTRTYLDNPANSDVNVVMWSWCGQVSDATEGDIITYLSLMNDLENDYPSIMFIYMTGHVDGNGLEGNLHIRNEQIREYCRTNLKILFDFADIESYDPHGNYFGDKYCTDNCDYDSNNDSNPYNDGANWAIEWQDAHPDDWYSCSSAHSQPLNANMKAYAAWWLWATLSGWIDPDITPTTPGYTPTNTSGLGTGLAFSLILSSLVVLVVIRTSYRKNRSF